MPFWAQRTERLTHSCIPLSEFIPHKIVLTTIITKDIQKYIQQASSTSTPSAAVLSWQVCYFWAAIFQHAAKGLRIEVSQDLGKIPGF